MPNWWERKKRQLGNLTRQAGNLTENVANVATLGTFETLEDAVSGRGFTNPLANMARSGRNLYEPIDDALFQPIEESIENRADEIIQTPEENLNAAQAEMASAREMAQKNWEQYLGGIDDFGGEFLQRLTNDGRFMPQHMTAGKDYGSWGGLDYQRGGQGFQDAPQFQAGQGPQYSSWQGQDLGSDPGYQFRMAQGLEALERQASAKGMSLSPALQQDQMKFAQGLASQEADKAFGRHMGEFGARRRVREFESPFQYGVHQGEANRLRGAMESDRAFGLGEWATMSPELYRQFAGERGFQYGQDMGDYQISRQRAQDDWSQQTFFPQFYQGVQAMRNPLGYTGQQMGLAQSAANMRMQQPTWLDYLGLGTDILSSGADIYSTFAKKG